MSCYPKGREPTCPVKGPTCLGVLTERSSKQCAACYNWTRGKTHEQLGSMRGDQNHRRKIIEGQKLHQRYSEALKRIGELEQALEAQEVIGRGVSTFTIDAKKGTRSSEGTVVAVASDWHIEERVGTEVGDLNRYTLKIAEERAKRFFQSLSRLVEILNHDLEVTTIVLALLGDFISGDIHDELLETAELPPVQAIVHAQNFLASGLEFLLKQHPTVDFVVPCHSGNHARTTKTMRYATEAGHSLEYLMYVHLAAYFHQEKRVSFIIPNSYHSYLDVYGITLRFHHGHAIRYAGGVGGLYIPVKKKIAQWNKARRATYDVFGHYHQQRDGGDFLCNGSLIGYNAFAVSHGFDFERPQQLLFLLDKKRGRTATWPILVE